MSNPYETPKASGEIRPSSRALWKKPLKCPECGQSAVSAGKACLLHPQFWIRCRNCRAHLRLKFGRDDWIRIQAVWVVAVGLALLMLVAIIAKDPFPWLDSLIWRRFSALPLLLRRMGGQHLYGPLTAGIVIVVFVTPILITSFLALRTNLKIIAFRSQLVSARILEAKNTISNPVDD